jgi:hypothetical protein
MAFQCVSEDSILRPPVKIDFSTFQPLNPLVLNGAPMTNHPSSLKSSGEYRRTADALTNPQTPKYYNDSNYHTIPLNTQNIIGPDSFGNTTMRFDEKNYTLQFIAVHAPIWKSESKCQLTMFFTSGENFLHVCIPIQLTNSDTNVNPFLRYWLYDESALPSGFTVNELFNFSSPKVSFTSLQYCLKYNNNTSMSPYTLLLFKTPLLVNVSKCKAWISNLGSPSYEPSMKKTFDDILNLMLHGTFSYSLRGVPDERLISTESHFSDDRTQNSVNPINYTVKREELFSKKESKEGFGNYPLQNVKCYPIDVNTQIDDSGQVIIDQDTNKPVDLASINKSAYGLMNPQLAMNAQHASQENNNWIRSWIVFIIIGVVALVAIIVAVIAFFRATSFVSGAAGDAAELGKAVRGAAAVEAGRLAALRATAVSAPTGS